jgi:6-phosphogluconolactonase
MEIHVYASTAALYEAAAERVAADLAAALEGRRALRDATASLALAGGSTPRPLYERLAAEPYRSVVPWGRVEVFWGDERCVPADHPASNYRMAREALLDHVPVAAERVHRWRGELAPRQAARLYAQELEAVLGRPPRLDLVLLGLGADGHTASLFPAAFAAAVEDGGDGDVSDDPHPGRWTAPATAPAEPRQRVTLTLSTLAAARRVLFLVAGADKAAAVARTLTPPTPTPRGGEAPTPARRVRPADGDVLWLLDAAAATDLPPELRRRDTLRP